MKFNTIIKLILTTLLVTGYSANGEEDEFVNSILQVTKFLFKKKAISG